MGTTDIDTDGIKIETDSKRRLETGQNYVKIYVPYCRLVRNV